jgi:hypothetical protein
MRLGFVEFSALGRKGEGDNLITSDIRTKSRHGGKRAGAGRPREYESIRSVFESQAQHALDYPEKHTTGEYATRWELARDTYIHRNAIRAVGLLRVFHDESLKDYAIRFLTGHQAYRIAHESEEEQREILKRDYRHTLLKAVEQYGPKYGGLDPEIEGTSCSTQLGIGIVEECKALLAEKVKRRKPKKSRFQFVR